MNGNQNYQGVGHEEERNIVRAGEVNRSNEERTDDIIRNDVNNMSKNEFCY